MPGRSSGSARKLAFQLHLWISLLLFLPLAPLGLTGAVLVWPEFINQATNPPPHVESASAAVLPVSAYLAAAGDAAPGARLQVVRLPARPTAAVAVTVNTGRPGPAGSETVWLDPADARVLKVAISTSPLFALSHDLHGHFLAPGVGRPLVGLAGVALLALSLTGLWLWWPRAGGVGRGLQWRRTPDGFMNLHHMLGFWISLPLAVVSLTGIFISFPPLTAAIFGAPPPAAQAQRPTRLHGTPRMTADEAVSAAIAGEAGPLPAAVTLPGAGGRGAAAAPPGVWRVELFVGDSIRTVQVDDATGAVLATPAADAGSSASPQRRIRGLHAGGGSLAWRLVVTLTGLFPLLLAATGVYTWARLELRKARRRADPASATA